MTTSAILTLLVAFCLGGAAAGTSGFGIVLVASPIIALNAPHLLPGVVLPVSVLGATLIALQEWRAADLRILIRLVTVAVPFNFVGAHLATVATTRSIALIVAGIVLLTVIISFAGWRPPPHPLSVYVAAAASGVAGGAVKIDGPPVALLLAGREPSLVRGTLSLYFLCTTPLIGLIWWRSGVLTAEVLWIGLATSPAMVAGVLIGRMTKSFFTPERHRYLLLSLCSAAALRAAFNF